MSRSVFLSSRCPDGSPSPVFPFPPRRRVAFWRQTNHHLGVGMGVRVMLYAGICASPAVAFLLLDWLWRLWVGTARWPLRLRPRVLRRNRRPVHPPIERLLVDLHCLGQELDRVRSTNAPAKVHRMTAVSLAYDDVLLMCCEELEIPTSGAQHEGLPQGERLQLEAALAQAGASW